MIWFIAAQHPYTSFGLVVLAVALPLLWAQRDPATGTNPWWAQRYAHWALVVAVVTCVVAAARYLLVARPLIEGVDFYYFLCIARDYLHDAPDSSLARFRYFPGGYRFWELVMSLFGERLSTLQYAMAGLLAANAVLTGLIVARCAGSVALAVVGGLWYLTLASRLEGLHATTEPIATLFALLGVLAWSGQPLRGAAGWRRALLLGAGLGLALWAKQQGGLIALGAAAIVVTWVLTRPVDRATAWLILAVPLAAVSTFVGAILLEGEGFAPLRIGLGFVGEYGAANSITDNLGVLYKRISFAWWWGLPALVTWCALLVVPGLRPRLREPWALVVGFALIAALATAVQFTRRPYLHYALLTAPFLAIAVTAAAARFTQAATQARPRFGSLIVLLVSAALLVPMVRTPTGVRYLHVWPPAWNPHVAQGTPWHLGSGVAANLDVLARLIDPGERVLLLPPRRNVVHFLLGTRSPPVPGAYGWSSGDLSDASRSETIAAALVLDPAVLDESDIATCASMHCDRAISALAGNGFEVHTRLKTMTLWRRTN